MNQHIAVNACAAVDSHNPNVAKQMLKIKRMLNVGRLVFIGGFSLALIAGISARLKQKLPTMIT